MSMIASAEFTVKDRATIEREYADLKELARRRCTGPGQMDIIDSAFRFASDALEGQRRRGGRPAIIHSVAVARIVVSEIGLGYKSVCAALLHDVPYSGRFTTEDISGRFGDKIASLVDGMSKIKSYLDKSTTADEIDFQAEHIKRVLLTLNDDARVVLIKLADRLENCRTIEYVTEEKRQRILSDTMGVFIPLAHRLGLYGMKSEMEDIWLRFREPEAYNDILAKTNATTRNKEKMIHDFLVPIRKALDDAGIEYVIKKRIKTPYSIWYKMHNKHVSFDQISDIYAVRIIFRPMSDDITEERNECYRIFAFVTSIYKYRPERVRDWAMHPKQNGYEALHLTVFNDEGTNIEVQIRTRRMDDIAERGISAHWNYKKLNPQTEESPMDRWMEEIKDIIENPDINSRDLLEIIKT